MTNQITPENRRDAEDALLPAAILKHAGPAFQGDTDDKICTREFLSELSGVYGQHKESYYVEVGKAVVAHLADQLQNDAEYQNALDERAKYYAGL